MEINRCVASELSNRETEAEGEAAADKVGRE